MTDQQNDQEKTMTDITGIRIDTDGTWLPWIAPAHDTLPNLYKATGGDLVECVQIAPDLSMWVDEEGLINGRHAPNPVGTALYTLIGGQSTIMGPVVFLGGVDDEGWTESLPKEFVETFQQIGAAGDPYLWLLERA